MGKTNRKAKAVTLDGAGAFTAKQVRTLGKADQLEAEAVRITTPAREGAPLPRGAVSRAHGLQREARRLAREVAVERGEQAEVRSVQTHLSTTAELETLRTGDAAAVVIPAAGPVRVKGRDGLASLLDSGTLTQGQVDAGLAYRVLYEMTGAGLRSGLSERTGGRGNADLAALQRAYGFARLTKVERAVGAGDGLDTLRLVAGEGWCVGAVAKGGAARKRCTEALVRALDAAAVALGLRIEGS